MSDETPSVPALPDPPDAVAADAPSGPPKGWKDSAASSELHHAAGVPEPEPGAIVAGPGQALVSLFDGHRVAERIVAVPEDQAQGFRLTYEDVTYERFGHAKDGRSLYAPMG